jgi:hypothetical protein
MKCLLYISTQFYYIQEATYAEQYQKFAVFPQISSFFAWNYYFCYEERGNSNIPVRHIDSLCCAQDDDDVKCWTGNFNFMCLCFSLSRYTHVQYHRLFKENCRFPVTAEDRELNSLDCVNIINFCSQKLWTRVLIRNLGNIINIFDCRQVTETFVWRAEGNVYQSVWIRLFSIKEIHKNLSLVKAPSPY